MYSREVETSETVASRLCLFQIFPDFSQEGQTGEYADLLLLLGIKSVLLRCDQVEQGFGPAVQVVQS